VYIFHNLAIKSGLVLETVSQAWPLPWED